MRVAAPTTSPPLGTRGTSAASFLTEASKWSAGIILAASGDGQAGYLRITKSASRRPLVRRVARHELAADDGSREFAGEAVVKPPQFANRHRLKARASPLAGGDNLLEPANRHPVQAHRFEARVSVEIEMGEPPQKRRLGK